MTRWLAPQRVVIRTMTMLTLTLEPELLAALEQMALAADRTVQDIVLDVLRAHLLPPPMALDLAALGDAILKDLEEADQHVFPTVHITDDMADAMSTFLLPEDHAQLSLGDELWAALVGFPPGASLTQEAAARQAGIITINQRLRGTLTQAGVRRWWTRTRSHLRGRTPLELLTPGWTPDGPEFRAVLALAEADAGFAAT